MLLRGCYLAAKKVAIALDTLIRTQYPRDHLAIVGFAYYAREIRPEALAELTWTRLRVRHQPPARPAARPADPGQRTHGGQQGDRGHHRRRADRPLRGRPGRVQLPADPADDPGDAPRGRSAARRRGSRSTRSCSSGRAALAEFVGLDAAQPRPRLLRRAGAPRRVRPRRLRQRRTKRVS